MPDEYQTLLFFIPSMEGDSTNLIALLHALERLLPGVELAWRARVRGKIEATDSPKWKKRVSLFRQPDRDRWLAREFANEDRLLLFNRPTNEGLSVTVPPFEDGRTRSNDAISVVHIRFSSRLVPDTLLPEFLAVSGDALKASWCASSPERTGVLLIQLQSAVDPRWPNPQRQSLLERIPALRQMPRLALSMRKWPAVEAPAQLGWLNYWSAAAARWLGFPDPERDKEWLARSVQTPSGGWVLKLTEAPLDLEQQEHVATLLRAYQRFERIERIAPTLAE